MNSMSDETKALIEEHIKIHGVPIMMTMFKLLHDEGCKVEPCVDKSIWDVTFKISRGDNSSEFYFHNTFVEILCVDRDDDPLIFDSEILGRDGLNYIAGKISEVLMARLTLIIGLFKGKTVEEIYNDNPGVYERIRAKEIGGKKS